MGKIITLILLISSSALAGEKIYQRVGGVPADNLCDDGAVFRTINPVPVCDQWKEIPSRGSGEHFVPGDWICTAPRMAQLEISKATTVCRKTVIGESFSGCVDSEPAIQTSTVIVQEKWMKDNWRAYDYTIPRCPVEGAKEKGVE